MLFCTISLIVLQITFVCDVDVLYYQSLKQESVVVKSYTKKKNELNWVLWWQNHSHILEMIWGLEWCTFSFSENMKNYHKARELISNCSLGLIGSVAIMYSSTYGQNEGIAIIISILLFTGIWQQGVLCTQGFSVLHGSIA